MTRAASSLRFSSFFGFLSKWIKRCCIKMLITSCPTFGSCLVSVGSPMNLDAETLKQTLCQEILFSVCLMLDSWTGTPHLVEVLVFSMVDIRRAKASATRLPELLGSSLAVVSSYSSGSTPEMETKKSQVHSEQFFSSGKENRFFRSEVLNLIIYRRVKWKSLFSLKVVSRPDKRPLICIFPHVNKHCTHWNTSQTTLRLIHWTVTVWVKLCELNLNCIQDSLILPVINCLTYDREAEMDVSLKTKKRRRPWAAADLGWRVSWWSLNPPQDQRNPSLTETSLRSLHSQGAVEVNNHRQTQRERETRHMQQWVESNK